MKALIRLFIVSFLFALCVAGNLSAVRAADTIHDLNIRSLGDRTIVLSWKTNQQSSSKVRFTSPAYGELSTPDYATHTKDHQVKVDGIFPDTSYLFFAESTDAAGDTAVSQALPFSITGNDSGSSDHAAFDPTPENLSSDQVGLVTILNEARDYTQSQSASFGFVILTLLLTLAIFFAEETTWVLFFDWILSFAALHLWHTRRNKHIFRILDSRSSRPIPGAEVAIVIGGQIVQKFLSNESGTILFSWPSDKPIEVRVTRKGFHAAQETFHHEVHDIALDPLFAPLGHDLLPPKTLFYLKHSLKVMHSASLALGTLLLVVSFRSGWSSLSVATTIIYIFLWLMFFFLLPRRFHVAQVIDLTTQQPIPFVKISGHGRGLSRRYITDRNGITRFHYPLPASLSLTKKGYSSITNQVVSATSIAPGILILGMQPIAKEANVSAV